MTKLRRHRLILSPWMELTSRRVDFASGCRGRAPTNCLANDVLRRASRRLLKLGPGHWEAAPAGQLPCGGVLSRRPLPR